MVGVISMVNFKNENKLKPVFLALKKINILKTKERSGAGQVPAGRTYAGCQLLEGGTETRNKSSQVSNALLTWNYQVQGFSSVGHGVFTNE